MAKRVVVLLACLFAGLIGCKHQPNKMPVPSVSDNFPPEVGKIIVSKCATSGCHNAASYQVSCGGLLLDSWGHLFEGGNTGAAVVAYSPENSSLLYFINRYEDFGPIPTDDMKMPLNAPPLSREEYLTLRNWILQGAPDNQGNIPFASNATTRQKIYVAHRGCDFVSVIDVEKNLLMRAVPVGSMPTIEAANAIKVAGSGTAYVSFWNNQYVQQIDTRSDSVAGEVNLGNPNSGALYPLPDNRDVLLVSLFTNSLRRINMDSRQVTGNYGQGTFSSPNDIAVSRHADTFFVTGQYGNTVYRVAGNGQYIKKVSIDGNPPSDANGLNPYNIVMTADHSRYFLSCQGSAEVRVMDAYADTLIKTIRVGATPQGMAIARSKPYLFVSCVDEPATIPLHRGAVYIINYNTYEVVKKINEGYYLPHTLVADDASNKLFVFSRNIDPDGPLPHHKSSTCSGRNGYYSVFDFDKLQPVNNKRYEITIDPFAADLRFK